MAYCKRLLTVDDNESEREIISRMLAKAFPGAEIRGAVDPSEVPALCAEHEFDCVLLDYDMPGVDGLTLARRIRAIDPHLPIILVTSVGDEMLVAEALRTGVSDYIVKSRVTVEAIKRIIERTTHAATQARVIEQQHEELENFSYALAHDFKQPIRQIMTFSHMISEELRGPQSEGVRRHLDFLGHAAGRLDKLVDVMVQYTLLGQPPELSDVGLDDVLAAVAASLAPWLAERRAELSAPRGAPRVRGNETLMIQVLQNLIVNGVRYNRSAPPRVEVVFREEAESCVIEVRDNGIGIAAEYLAEIFKPLMRLHSAKEYPGSGLGLTLARKAVYGQRGDIWCESTPGEGSVFSVRLPTAGDRGEAAGQRGEAKSGAVIGGEGASR